MKTLIWPGKAPKQNYHISLLLQVLYASLPVGIDAVDCDGTEEGLLECTSSSSFDDYQSSKGCDGVSTVLACGEIMATEGTQFFFNILFKPYLLVYRGKTN